MKPARPLDLAAIRARATGPAHFDAISARSEIPWLRETVLALADEVERLRASTASPPAAPRLSPLEMAIDRACGLVGAPLRSHVTLECPACGRKVRVERHASDLAGTARVVARCDRCDNGSGEVLYFDAAGLPIMEPQSS